MQPWFDPSNMRCEMARSARVWGEEQPAKTVALGDRIRKGKIRGTALGEIRGLMVYYNVHQPKTEAGKRRITISVRQLKGKRYRNYAALITPYGADITFERN
jgi:hypothetical protein